ncbi:MAG: hypothetical protein NTW86_26575 [Candidatus Sumerlaeota bacterium]|nr:hypothetical protein [Candidatus Sumerlaeota bacterium]
MRRARVVKQFLIVAVAAAAGAALAVSAIRLDASLTESTDSVKAFEVRLVRGPFPMDDIRGCVKLEEQTGCYIVWSESRVEVYRVGWNDPETFDCAPIWGGDFQNVRGVTPVGDGSTCFVIYTKNAHFVFKADWFLR